MGQEMRLVLETHIQQHPWLMACVLTVLIGSFYLYMDIHATLWDRDEPRFCRATAEMIESGNYLVPTFNGKLRPDKPILIYWLMSLPMRLLGPTELACRFAGAVGTALTCFLTFFIGKRLFNARVGLWSMLILSTSLMVLYLGCAATADAVLLPFMVGQMAVFVAYRQCPKRHWGILWMGLAMGGALLAKGPVGLLPGLAMCVTLGLSRKQGIWQWRHWELLLAFIIGTGLFLAWAIPANQATDGEFLRMGIGHHVLKRSAQPLEHHGGRFLLSLPFYLPVILVGFFPWVLFLPNAVLALRKSSFASKIFESLFLGWTIPLLVVMTLVATKLPHYILFMWPALALAVAASLENPSIRIGFWIYVVQGLLGVTAMFIAPWFSGIPGLGSALSVCALILLYQVVLVIRANRQDRIFTGASTLVSCSILFVLVFVTAVLPRIETIKITPPIARLVNERYQPGMSIATYGYDEPSLDFYIGQQLNHLNSAEDVLMWCQGNTPGLLIISEKEQQRLKQQGVTLPSSQIGKQSGFNYTKGKLMTVHVLQR